MGGSKEIVSFRHKQTFAHTSSETGCTHTTCMGQSYMDLSVAGRRGHGLLSLVKKLSPVDIHIEKETIRFLLWSLAVWV